MYRGTAIDFQISKLIDPELTIVVLLIEPCVKLKKNVYNINRKNKQTFVILSKLIWYLCFAIK